MSENIDYQRQLVDMKGELKQSFDLCLKTFDEFLDSFDKLISHRECEKKVTTQNPKDVKKYENPYIMEFMARRDAARYTMITLATNFEFFEKFTYTIYQKNS